MTVFLRRSAAILLCLAGCLAMPVQSQPAGKLLIGLGTHPTLIYGVHYLMVSRGFLKEEGLDAEFVVLDGTATLVTQMAQKRIFTAWPNPDALIISRQPGRDPLPLRCAYNGVRTTAWEFAVPEASPIKTLADLKGKRIGVITLAMGNVPITRALMAELGIKDYELLPVSQGAPAFRALQTGAVDALNLFDGQHLQLELAGTRIRRLQQPDKYENQFSNCWVFHEETLRDRGEQVARFGRAFAKASIACQANWNACVRSYWQVFPDQKPAEGSEEQKLERSVKILRARTDKFFNFRPGEPRRLGSYAEQDWLNFVEALHAGGQIKTRDIPVRELYTNQFVEAYNRFDADAVARTARGWQ